MATAAAAAVVRDQRVMTDAPAAQLTPGQHRAREQCLTQRHAARTRIGADDIILKYDDTFLVADAGGDIGGDQGRGLGLFYGDTRFLSLYRLTLDERALIALSSEHGGGDWATHALENEALEEPHGSARGGVPHSIAVRRYRTAGDAQVREHITVSNYDVAAAHLCLRLRFAADFADVFLVRSISAHSPGVPRPAQLQSDRVTLRCVGDDGRERSTTLQFAPAPARLDSGCALFELQLEPRGCREIDVHISLQVSGGAPPRRHREAARDPRRLGTAAPPHGQELLDTAARVSSHPLLERVIRRSLLDLSLLRCRLSGDLHYIAGGVPWYVTLFGRDSALCALQLCAFRSAIAGDTARLLALHQATQFDSYRDAQPGKILHELRRGQLAHLGCIPQSPAYYGSIDATLLFLILLAEYVDWSADLAIARELRGNLDAALAWIERYGDSDGDGYLDYGGHRHATGQYSTGLVNQGWKDSGDAIVNADGSLAAPPIALCEVQGYLYRAWRSTAGLLRLLEDRAGAEQLERNAAALRSRFERDFWSDELGCYLLARQQGGRAAAVVSSNAGQVLWSGICSQQHAAAVIERMMAPDMFSGWGVRTLSSNAVRYNPLSYHLGSVWPHDNSILCAGFRRYRGNRAALQIFDALFAAASGLRDHRMPELYCGFERSIEQSQPIPYPVACSPQAWAAGALPFALTSLLGLQPDAMHRRLQIIDPCLPGWLDRLALDNVQVGDACVDLQFERSGTQRVEVEARVRSGELRVACA
jgi:glycogen debranching enzyme